MSKSKNLSIEKKAEYFDILNASINTGISILDENLNYLYINDFTYKQLNINKDELKEGDSLDKCHALMKRNGMLTDHIVQIDRLSALEQRKQNSIGTENTAVTVKLANGDMHSLERKRLDNGYTVSMSHDVTQLSEKDRMLEQALDLGNAGYWIYDFKTKRYTLSDSFKHTYSEDIIANIHKSGILITAKDEDQAKLRTALKNAPKCGDTFDVTFRSSHFQDRDVFHRTMGKITRDETGAPLKIRAFIQDISQSHYQAKDLEDAKDDAIAASKAKSEFLANMSHEIRTPMNGVLGMAELLEQSDIDERQRDYVKVITRSSEALLTIINDILDFSKIEADALELDPVAFNLRDAIDDVMALLAMNAIEKNLELIVNYSPSMPRSFIGDVGRIRQVITNLVGNAIKFTENGHILLSVDITQETQESAQLNISVKDTGIGIARSKLNTIFQKFTQADGGTTRVYGGTGLGLTISKRIAELMGGDIRVESKVGDGSTFYFDVTLPRDYSAPSVSIHKDELEELKVLIVDDIEVNRNILAERFASWGMRPFAVNNSMSALVEMKAALEAGDPYKLAVLDYLMPGINGMDLAGLLASNADFSNVPLIMLSSCEQDVSRESLKELNIHSYIVKPVREKRLLDTLCKVMCDVGPVANSIDGSTESEDTSSPFIKPQAPSMAKTSAVPAPNNVTQTLKEIESALALMQTALPTLARDRKTTEPKRILVAPPSPTQPETPSKRPVKILVAEDFPLNQDVVSLMLEDTIYSPVFANNGQQAVSLFKQNPEDFKAVIMDISMPVMDGYEASEIIKSMQKITGMDPIPIVALTGHALKHDREKCLDSNMDDYLTKPVKQSELISTLDKWVFGQASSGIAASA